MIINGNNERISLSVMSNTSELGIMLFNEQQANDLIFAIKKAIFDAKNNQQKTNI